MEHEGKTCVGQSFIDLERNKVPPHEIMIPPLNPQI
jgi:hypothetical protein